MTRRTVSALVAMVCLALAAPVASASAVEPNAVEPNVAAPNTAVKDTAVKDTAVRDAASRRAEALKAVTRAGAVAAIAQVRDEDGVWRAGTGAADLTTGAPVRTDGRFRAGSITKMFTSTTVLQLVGEGRVGLDDPIERYLPGAVPNGEHITVRQLLNHSSGLWDPTNEKGGVFPDLADPGVLRNWLDQGGMTRTITPAQVVATSVAHAPNFPPGERFAYSNVNYTLLGMIIERVTGRGYAQEISARILRPLGMNGTSFPGTATDIRGPHAHGYLTLVEGPGPEDRSDRDVTVASVSWANSAGELISTLDDLNRFEKALLGGRLLSEKLMREMTTTIPVKVNGQPTGLDYGLGLARLQLSCGPVYGHDGSVAGYSSQLWSSGGRQVALSVTPRGDQKQGLAQLIAQGGFLEEAFCGTHGGGGHAQLRLG
ncbi:serine hydrolase domain-containing protein [Kitasatospora sp. NPDC058190]|uniref:serine hydrolase domain-containing protein n=1 Tax=Kitasatospora sp. NPDC058190 TaxID=3346371 RepID=UPI0036D9B127